jgi:1-acyl-sn-glycerol-3-phosphate acyltransferase
MGTPNGAGPAQDRTRAVLRPIADRLWKINTAGFDQLPSDGPAILCPNHISFLDSAFLMLKVPRRISFVGKSEYMDSWKTRHVFPALGMIPIDRSGGSASRAALDAAESVLRRGELFGIFPEGTRSRDGLLYKGHTGAARLAVKVGCPIFPIGVVGTDKIQPPDAKLPKLRLSCSITVGRAIDPTRYAHRTDHRLVLRQLTDELMYEIAELSGQRYVDRYATRKAEGMPTPEAEVGVVSDADSDDGVRMSQNAALAPAS